MQGPGTDTWYTPQWIVDWAYDYLGGPPDFDPASDPAANIRVGARIYDAFQGGRVVRVFSDGGGCIPDPGPEFPAGAKRVFMNPPFSRARAFTRRLTAWYQEDFNRRFVAVLPANPNSAYWQDLAHDYYVFLPRQRVAFVDPNTGLPAESPRGNVCLVFSTPPTKVPHEGIFVR